MRRVSPWNITEYPSVKDSQDNQDTLAGAKIAADITIAYVRAMTGVCPSGRLKRENARRFYTTPDRLETVLRAKPWQADFASSSGNHSVLNI